MTSTNNRKLKFYILHSKTCSRSEPIPIKIFVGISSSQEGRIFSLSEIKYYCYTGLSSTRTFRRSHLMSLRTLTSLLLCLGVPSLSFAQWQPVEAFTTDGEGEDGVVASNASGNAIAVFIDSFLESSYFTGGVWGPFQIVDPIDATADGPDVAMDSNNNALAIWRSDTTHNVRAGFFNGSSWSTPVDLDVGAGFLFGPSQVVAMSGPGEGVAAWINATTLRVVADFFTGGSWQTSTPIDIGIPPLVNPADPSISYSSNGSVIAAWLDLGTSTVYANNYIGGSWQTAQIIGMLSGSPSNVETGIDANGNGLAAWVDSSGNVNASYFNGTNWEAPVLVTTNSPMSQYVSLSMSPSGQAIVIWEDTSDNGFSSSFNGTTWSTPIPFASNLEGPGSFLVPGANVAMNSDNNAFVVWGDGTSSNVFSATLPSGANAWSAPELIGPIPNFFSLVDSSLSDNGAGFVIWVDENLAEGGSNVFGSAAPALFPPVSMIKGRVCKNRFATATDRVKIITWTPSSNPTTVAYQIRRNGVLIATIPLSGPFTYRDHHRCKHSDVYTVTEINALGEENNLLTVTIK